MEVEAAADSRVEVEVADSQLEVLEAAADGSQLEVEVVAGSQTVAQVCSQAVVQVADKEAVVVVTDVGTQNVMRGPSAAAGGQLVADLSIAGCGSCCMHSSNAESDLPHSLIVHPSG